MFDEEFTDQAKQILQTHEIPTQRSYHTTAVPVNTLPPQGGNGKKKSNESILCPACEMEQICCSDLALSCNSLITSNKVSSVEKLAPSWRGDDAGVRHELSIPHSFTASFMELENRAQRPHTSTAFILQARQIMVS